MGRTRVSSCKCWVFVSRVLPVAVRRAVFCMIWRRFVFVCDMMGDHVVDAYSSIGLVIVLYVVMIVSFCLPQVVPVRAFRMFKV